MPFDKLSTAGLMPAVFTPLSPGAVRNARIVMACMSRWCKQGMPYSVEHLVDCLMGIVPKRLYDLLDNPVDPEYY